MCNNCQCFKKKVQVPFIQLSRDEYTAEIIKQIKRTLKAHHNVDVKFEEISSKKTHNMLDTVKFLGNNLS
jgi:RNA-binding protein YhbY